MDVGSLSSPSLKPSYCELSFKSGVSINKDSVRALMEVMDNATGDLLVAVPLY